VLLKDENGREPHGPRALPRETDGALVPVRRRGPVFGIMPRNLQQTMALDLLLDDSVKLVSLIGSPAPARRCSRSPRA
jgi:hypothetical protein